MSEVKDVIFHTFSAMIQFVSTLVHRIESTVNLEELNDKLHEECVNSLTTYDLESMLLEDVQKLWKITDVVQHTNSNIYLKIAYVVDDETQTKEICVFEDGTQTFRDAVVEEYVESDVLNSLNVEAEFQDWMNQNVPSRFDLLKNWMEETGADDLEASHNSPYAKYIDEITQAALDDAKKLGELSIKIKKDDTTGDYQIIFHNDETNEELSWTFDTAKDKLLALVKKYTSEAEVKAEQAKSYLAALREKLNKR